MAILPTATPPISDLHSGPAAPADTMRAMPPRLALAQRIVDEAARLAW